MTMSERHSIEDQIIYGKIAAVNRHAGDQLQRISRSSLIAESGAFATGVVTPSAGLVHQVQGEVEHLYALRAAVRAIYDQFAYDLEEGDVLISADAYKGGTKGQTLTMVLPVFKDGELTLSPVIRAQMADLGGEYPGGYNPEAFEVWQESMRVTPIKLYVGGKLQRDVRRFLLANSRTADLLGSDLEAMRACLQQARRSLLAIADSYGSAKVGAAVSSMIAHTRSRALRQLPQSKDIVWTGAAKLPVTGHDGSIYVRMERTKDSWLFDFAGSAEQVHAPYNCTFETAAACAVTAMLAEHLDELPVSDGLLDVFQFQMPSGSIVHPAFPSATALGFQTTGQAVAASVTAALQSNTDDEVDRSIAVHGPAPMTVLYAPIGTQSQIEPVFVEPGFPIAQSGWGPPVLQGRRKLVSAEELEWRSGLRVEHRTLTEETGEMEVRIQVLRGSYESCIFVPGTLDNMGGEVTVESGGKVYAGTSAGLTLASGAVLQYRYFGSAKNTTDRKGTKTDDTIG